MFLTVPQGCTKFVLAASLQARGRSGPEKAAFGPRRGPFWGPRGLQRGPESPSDPEGGAGALDFPVVGPAASDGSSKLRPTQELLARTRATGSHNEKTTQELPARTKNPLGDAALTHTPQGELSPSPAREAEFLAIHPLGAQNGPFGAGMKVDTAYHTHPIREYTPLGPSKKSGRSRPDPAKFLVSSNSGVFSAFASSSMSGSEFLISGCSY